MTKTRLRKHEVIRTWLETCKVRRGNTNEEILRGIELLEKLGTMGRVEARIARYEVMKGGI